MVQHESFRGVLVRMLRWFHSSNRIMESSQHIHVNSSWAPPELLVLDYGWPQHYRMNSSWMNGSCWIMDSLQHSDVSTSWMAHVAGAQEEFTWICCDDSIIQNEPFIQEEFTWKCSNDSIVQQWLLWMTTALSYELLLNEWLMLDYGFITAFWCKHILNGPCCIIEFS
jgi:hypothetical protein